MIIDGYEIKTKANTRTYPDGSTRYTGLYLGQDGKWKSAGTEDTKDAALAKAAVAGADAFRNGVEKSKGKMTVTAFFDTVFVNHVVNWEPTTQDANLSGWVNHLKPHFGEMAISEVNLADVQGWCAKMKKKSLAPSTQHKMHSILHKIFSYAIETDYRIKKNPCRDTARYLDPMQPPPVKIMSQDEFQKFLGCVPEFWKPIVIVAVTTGMRLNELRGLRPDCIDWANNRANVKFGVTYVRKERHGTTAHHKDYTKGRTERVVPLSQEGVEALEAVRAARNLRLDSSERLFLGPAGGEIDINHFSERIIKSAMIAAGLGDKGYTMKHLRSSYCSWLLEAGVDLPTVQKMMGHKHITTTQRYIQASSDAEDKVAAALNGPIAARRLKVVPTPEEQADVG